MEGEKKEKAQSGKGGGLADDGAGARRGEDGLFQAGRDARYGGRNMRADMK